MKVSYGVENAFDIIQMSISGVLNANPIGQRPPISQSYSKSESIMKSFISGFGMGIITLRNISEDPEMQKVYPNVRYLVIDGGHRVRALVDFYKNKFSVNKKKFKDLNLNLSEFIIPIDYTICTSQESIEKFRNLNETTKVNEMEMLMCDDQSDICRHIRSFTRYYHEYKNDVHNLFETKLDIHGMEKSIYFDMSPNHRRKWDEYAYVAIIKSHGGGNVDAGYAEMYKYIDDEYNGNNIATKTVIKNVNRFFDDIYSLAVERKPYRLNTDIFAAMQVVWFGLYEKNKNFKIDDYEKFYERFMYAYSLLTGNADTTYNNKTHHFDGETYMIKEFVRKNTTNFSNHKMQKECAKLILSEMGDDIGVIFRESKRSVSTSEREEMLAIQNYKCAIDGRPLKLEDSVWGHDTAWAHGGSLKEGAVIRKSHNRDMGTTTLDEYRMILRLREEKTA